MSTTKKRELLREYDAIADAIGIVARLKYRVVKDPNLGYLILGHVGKYLLQRNNEIVNQLEEIGEVMRCK